MPGWRNFIVSLNLKALQYFLVWRSGDDVDGDRMLCAGESNRFLIRSSLQDIELAMNGLGLLLELEEPSAYDLDRLFLLLETLTPAQRLGLDDCELLLNCWNLFEDMAKTLHLPLEEMEEGKADMLGDIYQRLFYGNNLPSITPEGEKFEPEFIIEEIEAMRAYYSAIWAEVFARNELLWGT